MQTLAACAQELVELVHPMDIVTLHDQQPSANRDRGTAPGPAAVPRPAPPGTLLRNDEQGRRPARAQRGRL